MSGFLSRREYACSNIQVVFDTCKVSVMHQRWHIYIYIYIYVIHTQGAYVG